MLVLDSVATNGETLDARGVAVNESLPILIHPGIATVVVLPRSSEAITTTL
jgi:hypothetical protein